QSGRLSGSMCRNSKSIFFSRSTIAARCTHGQVLKLTSRYFAMTVSGLVRVSWYDGMLGVPVEGPMPSSGGAVLARLSPLQTRADEIGEDPMKPAACAMLLALLPVAAAAGERPEWAFGPERTGEAVPRRPDDGQLKQAPGSAKLYTQAQIDDP